MASDKVQKLEKKINSLEEKISRLENKTINSLNEFGFNVYNKNLLNKNIISGKTFRIKNIENNKSHALFFQLKIKFLNYNSQDIQFKLLADKILIGSETVNRDSGIGEMIVYGTYQNTISDTIKIDLFVNPKSNKQVTILDTTLTVWGDKESFSEEYNAAETSTHYFLSYISNNRLYYKYFLKTSNFEENDFVFFEEATAHSVCVFNDEIIIFRVDPDGNLFYSKFGEFNEIFIENNVSKISCCNDNNSIIYSYISNENCFYGEIINGNIVSNNQITVPFGKFTNCYNYYNKYNSKCYLIITKKDGSNYLLEDIKSQASSTENVSTQIGLEITTEEGE